MTAISAGSKGSYVLVLSLTEDARLTVGRLGTFAFPAGHYLYCGSALNGLEARIRRHLRRDKKRHWHVDYLSAQAEILEVWWVLGEERRECIWARAVTAQRGEIVAPGFGSSDCRCPTHLFRIKDRDRLVTVRLALLGDEGNRRRGVWKAYESKDSQSFELRES